MSPLSGWRVLLPRPTGRSTGSVSLLSAEGAEAQAIPMITIRPPRDVAAVDAALLALAAGDYTWAGFTSVNAVTAVLDRARTLGLSPAVPADTRSAAVGPATATVLRKGGVAVDLVPERGGSAAALAAIWPTGQPGDSVLLPQSEIAGPTLRERLMDKGFRVDAVPVYRTVPTPPPPSVAADLASGLFEAVLFTSPSTVAALAAVRIAPSTVIGAIGPSTAQAAAAAGMTVAFTAAAPTDRALIQGLVAVAARRRQT